MSRFYKCPKCGKFLAIAGHKEVYARTKSGRVVTIQLWGNHCKNCDWRYVENYTDKIKQMGLSKY